MDDGRWHEVRKLFEAVVERGTEARDRALGSVGPEVRREVEALLSAHERAKGAEEKRSVEDEGPGSVIGRYKLLQEIGRGGFGVVYMAEQTEPVRRQVALKIIKLGMDTRQVVARFEAERQALALMDHPHIARILDGGATDAGRPYFVMELVRGIPITDYCDEAALDTTERLRLFASVCHALQHAHQKGIIHRDLKPSNVLVTLHDGKPVPKVIDFGIAKAIDRRLTEKTLFTEFQQVVGTPEYMAPEQAGLSALDVDTRADIYSLGVMLYELLTGTKPFDLTRLLEKGWDEILRTIKEQEPPRPSTRVSTLGKRLPLIARKRHVAPRSLGMILRGDLDWIVMKALEKDRSRRYETANAMALDLERHLADEPVLAGPPGRVYRMRKYVRRHRGAVAAAGVMGLALVGGLIVALLGLGEARWERERAVTERDAAREARRSEAAAREAEEAERQRAEESAGEARRERDEKERARADLEKALRRSEGIRLLAQSQATLPRDPTLSLLLAIEGAERHPGIMANRALLTAMETAPRREIRLPRQDYMGAALDPQGERLITSHGAGVLTLWDARTGDPIRTFSERQERAFRFHWSEDGRTIVSCGRHVHLWDPDTGEERRRLPTADDTTWDQPSYPGFRFVMRRLANGTTRIYDVTTGRLVHEVSFAFDSNNASLSPTGAHLLFNAASSPDRVKVLWDLRAGKEAHRWPNPLNGFWWFSPDGRLVAGWTEDEQVFLWDIEERGVLHRLEGHEAGTASNVVFTADGRRVLTADSDTVRAFDVASGRLVSEMESRALGWIQVSPDGERVAASHSETTGERSARVFDIATGERIRTIPLDPTGVPVQFDQSGERLLLARGKVILVDLAPLESRSRIRGQCHVARLVRHPDGRRLFAGAATGPLPCRLWDLARREPCLALQDFHTMWLNGHFSQVVRDAAFSPDGRRLATVGSYGRLAVWETDSGRKRVAKMAHEPYRGAWTVAWHPDGSRIVTAGDDRVAHVWDAGTGELRMTLGEVTAPDPRNPGAIWVYGRWAGYRPDGRHLLTRLVPNRAQVWDATTGRLVLELDHGPDQDITHAAYGPSGAVIRTSTGAGHDLVRAETRLWDADTGALLHTLAGGCQAGQPHSGFNPTGDRLAVPVADEGVRIYETGSGRSPRTLPMAAGHAAWAWFSPDGAHVVGVKQGNDKVVVWNVESGECVLDVAGAVSMSPSVCFGPDSRTLLLVDRKHRLRVLPLYLLAAAKRLRPREPTQRERTRYELGEAPARVERREAENPPEPLIGPPGSICGNALREEALLARLAGMSADDPGLADAHRELGFLYHGARRPTEAEPHLRRALELYRAGGQDSGGSVQGAHHALGHALERKGNHPDAIRELETARDLEARTLPAGTAGRLPICVATARAEEANAREDWAAAVTLYREAIDLSDHQYGVRAIKTLTLRRVLAGALDRAGERVAAEAELREIVSIVRDRLAVPDAVLPAALVDLSLLLRDTGNRIGARRCLREALRQFRAVLVLSPSSLDGELRNLDQRLRKAGWTEAAEGPVRAALDRIEPDWRAVIAARDGAGDVVLARMHYSLGRLHRGREQHAEAEAEHREAVVRFRRARRKVPGSLPELDLEVSASLASLGVALLEQEKAAEAEVVVREALDLRSRLIPRHPLRYNAMGLLGEALFAQGQRKEAEPFILAGDEGMAPGSPWKEEAGKRVRRLREAQGK